MGASPDVASTDRRRLCGRCLPIFTISCIFTCIVKNPKLLNITGPLERDTLRFLREIPGVIVKPTALTGRHSDVVIRAGDVTRVVEVKSKRLTNVAAARQVVEYAQHLPAGTHLLLVTRTSTEDARQLLEDHEIGIMDTQGNTRIQFPGLFLWTEGRLAPPPRERQKEPPVKLTGKAGVAAQALLGEPQRKWQVHYLAKTAGISMGLAHRVLVRLERENLIEAEGAGPTRTRRVVNPTALLDLWAEEMRDRGVKQLRAFRLARDPQGQAKILSRALTEAKIAHAMTGPAAATRLAPFVTAVPLTDIWVTDAVTLDEVAAAARADVVREGPNIVLRQSPGDAPLAYSKKMNDIWVVDRFRLYYDLRHNPQRGREQADRLRTEVIGF